MHTSRLLLLLLLVTSPLLIQAQSDKPIGGHFGVKIGASFTQVSITGTTVNIPKRSLAPNLGVMYRYRYNRLVFQPEALLAVKGGTFQQEQVGGRTTTSNSYYYVSAPILLGYIPTEGLTIQAGPEFSYALNSGSTNGPGAQNDLGAVLGVHYDFLDMLSKFSLHVRYVYGFTNVSNEATAAYYNRNLQVSIVYTFSPRRKNKLTDCPVHPYLHGLPIRLGHRKLLQTVPAYAFRLRHHLTVYSGGFCVHCRRFVCGTPVTPKQTEHREK